MGTHPIFESDFDCLTEPKMLFPDLEKELERTSTPSTYAPSVKSTSTKGNRKSQLPKQEGKCKISAIIDCQDEVFCCELSPSNVMVAIGTNRGTVKVYRVSDFKQLYSLADMDIRKEALPAVCCDWLSESKLVVGYASGYIKLWNVSNAECLQSLKENRTVLQTSLSPDRSALVTTGSDSELHIYDTPTLTRTLTCYASPSHNIMDGHRTSVYAIKHHPVDTWNFISGGWDDTIQFWDRREEHSTRRIFGPHICGQALDVNSKDNTILSASWRLQDAVQLWDYRQGRLLRTFPEMERSMYYAAQFLGDDSVLVGGSNKNALKVKDKLSTVDTGEISNFKGGVFCCDHSEVKTQGESLDVRACFGCSTNLIFVDISGVGREERYSPGLSEIDA